MNILAKHANKHSLAVQLVVASVSRAACDLVLLAGVHATSMWNAMTARIKMLRRFFAYGTLAGSLWTSLALASFPLAPRGISRAPSNRCA